MSRDFRFSVSEVICLYLSHTLLFQQPQSFANKVLVECYSCNYTLQSYKSFLCKSSVIISSYRARSTRHTGAKAVCQLCVRKAQQTVTHFVENCCSHLFPFQMSCVILHCKISLKVIRWYSSGDCLASSCMGLGFESWGGHKLRES